MNRRLWIGLLAMSAFCAAKHAPADSAGEAPTRLCVSSDGRHLATPEGRPFLWLADTGWELLHRLNREDADLYLKTRAAQGFTAIQTMILSEEDGLRTPNAYGDVPLHEMDPRRPNERYFQHVDYIVRKANSLGLVVALFPTWGDKVCKAWGQGPEIFNADNARAYGEYVGRRYRDAAIVWVLGGDRDPRGYEAVWRAMARGLKAGDGGRHPATFHGAGPDSLRGSAPFFHSEDWLDFNMYYSGHWLYAPIYEGIARDRRLRPVKPTLDGEPIYENHPYMADGSNYHENRKKWDGATRAMAHDVRRAAYWAMLAGAAGHTYGCNDVWQFYDPKRAPAILQANTPWRKALDFPGAREMGFLRRLLESRPWTRLTPDAALIVEGQQPGEGHLQAARTPDGSLAMAYITLGTPLSVDLGRLARQPVHAWWFDPREGQAKKIGTWASAGGPRRFVPPGTSGRGNDWVLVLNAAAQEPAPPGTASAFEWQRATPESQGFCSAKLDALRADLAARNTDALLIIRNDRIVCEWYAPGHGAGKPQGTASLAKAIVGGLSLAVAMSDGRIALDDPAAKFIPQWRGDPRKSRITQRQLGSHTSGIEDAEADGKRHEELTGWKGDFWKRLAVPNDPFTVARDRAPLVFAPGEKMQYSNPGIALLTYCVTASLRDAPQRDIRTLLRDRVMRPIGVPDREWSAGYGQTFNVDDLPMVASWGGGAYTPRAAARIGRLMLRQGDWDGRRLLSAEAVRLTTSDAGTPGPCGMSWWSNNEGEWAKLPRDAFFGSGAGHQILLVVPSLNLLVVRNGNVLANVQPTPDAYHDAYRRFLFEPLMDALTGRSFPLPSDKEEP